MRMAHSLVWWFFPGLDQNDVDAVKSRDSTVENVFDLLLIEVQENGSKIVLNTVGKPVRNEEKNVHVS